MKSTHLSKKVTNPLPCESSHTAYVVHIEMPFQPTSRYLHGEKRYLHTEHYNIEHRNVREPNVVFLCQKSVPY